MVCKYPPHCPWIMLNLAEQEFSLLINMKMPTIDLLARHISCLAELSMKNVYNLGAWAYGNSESPDQPTKSHSLIRVFVIHRII